MGARLALALLATGAAVAGAAAAPVLGGGACPSGAWHGPAAPFTWVPDPGCEPTLTTPDAVAGAWCGREVVFVGDSTTREFVYDTALWLAGCAVPPLPPAALPGGGSAAVCARVARLRTLRNVSGAEFELPCQPIDSGSVGAARRRRTRGSTSSGSLLLRYLRVEQLRTLTAKPWWRAQLARWTAAPASQQQRPVAAVVLNAGLWNLRHDGKVAPPDGPGPDPDAIASIYVAEVESLLAHLRTAALAPAARSALRRVLVWRTMLPLEARAGVTVGAFTRARVAAANAATAPRWAAAGYRVLDVWRYGVHAAWPDLGGAGDGPAEPGGLSSSPPRPLGSPVDLGDGLPPPVLAAVNGSTVLLLTRDGIHFPGPVNVEMARGLLGGALLAAGAEAERPGGVKAAGGADDSGRSGSWAWWPWAAGDGALPPPAPPTTGGGSAGETSAVSPWLAAAAVAVALGAVAGRLRSHHHARRAAGSVLQPDVGGAVTLAASEGGVAPTGRAVTVRSSAAAAPSPSVVSIGGTGASAGSVPGWQRRRG